MTAIERLRLSLLLLALVVALGVVGYVWIEGWPVFDAFYMTVVTLSTIGYGETRPLGTPGRVFTIILIAGGVTTLSLIIRSMVDVIGGQNLRIELRSSRMQHRLARIEAHLIVCGYGRMGRVICEELRASGTEYVVIDRSPEVARHLASRDILFVEGDASDDAVLLEAGVARARGLIAVAPNDEDNVFIVLSARALNPELLIVARSVYERDEHKIRRAGADRVISPYVIGGRQIAAAVLNEDEPRPQAPAVSPPVGPGEGDPPR